MTCVTDGCCCLTLPQTFPTTVCPNYWYIHTAIISYNTLPAEGHFSSPLRVFRRFSFTFPWKFFNVFIGYVRCSKSVTWSNGSVLDKHGLTSTSWFWCFVWFYTNKVLAFRIWNSYCQIQLVKAWRRASGEQILQT